ARKLVEAVTAELYALSGFDDQFRDLVRQARGAGGADLAERWHQLEREEQTLAQRKEHLLEAITAYGPKPMFAQKLSELEAAVRALASRRQALAGLRMRPLDLPDSVAQLRRLLEDGFQRLALDSPEFGEFLRPL